MNDQEERGNVLKQSGAGSSQSHLPKASPSNENPSSSYVRSLEATSSSEGDLPAQPSAPPLDEPSDTASSPPPPPQCDREAPIICIECEMRNASKYCMKCEANLCDECFMSVHKLKVNREHPPDGLDPREVQKCVRDLTNSLQHVHIPPTPTPDEIESSLFVYWDPNDKTIRTGRSFRTLFPGINGYIPFVSIVGASGVGKSTLLRGLIKDGAPAPIGAAALSGSCSADLTAFEGADGSVILDSEGIGGSQKPTHSPHIRSLSDANDSTDWENRRKVISTAYPRLLYAFSSVLCFVFTDFKSIETQIDQLLSFARTASQETSNCPIKPSLIIIFNKIPLVEGIWGTKEATARWKETSPARVQQLSSFYRNIHVLYIPLVNVSTTYSEEGRRFVTQKAELYYLIQQEREGALRKPSSLLIMGRSNQFELVRRAVVRLSKNVNTTLDFEELSWTPGSYPSMVSQLVDFFKSLLCYYQDCDIIRFSRRAIHLKEQSPFESSSPPPWFRAVSLLEQRLLDIISSWYREHSLCPLTTSEHSITDQMRDVFMEASQEISRLAPSSKIIDYSKESSNIITKILYTVEAPSPFRVDLLESAKMKLKSADPSILVPPFLASDSDQSPFLSTNTSSTGAAISLASLYEDCDGFNKLQVAFVRITTETPNLSKLESPLKEYFKEVCDYYREQDQIRWDIVRRTTIKENTRISPIVHSPSSSPWERAVELFLPMLMEAMHSRYMGHTVQFDELVLLFNNVSTYINTLAPCTATRDFSGDSGCQIGQVRCENMASSVLCRLNSHQCKFSFLVEDPATRKTKPIMCQWLSKPFATLPRSVDLMKTFQRLLEQGSGSPHLPSPLTFYSATSASLNFQSSFEASSSSSQASTSVNPLEPPGRPLASYLNVLEFALNSQRDVLNLIAAPMPYCIICFRREPSFVGPCGHNFCYSCSQQQPYSCLLCPRTPLSRSKLQSVVPPLAGVRILSLEGGGVRGVVPLLALAQLETLVYDIPIMELFDYIAGTSTGGIIALGLGTGKQTVNESLAAYRSLSETVFQRKNPVSQILTQCRYDAKTLETELRKILDGPRLFGASKPQLCIVACEQTKSPEAYQPYLFTSYLPMPLSRSPEDGPQRLFSPSLVDAARATSATPTFFECFIMKEKQIEKTLLDGGLYANCPANIALEQTELLWPQHPLDVITSFATGFVKNTFNAPQSSSEFKNFIVNSLELLTRSTKQWEDATARLPSTTSNPGLRRHHRINPTLSQDFQLDDASQVPNICMQTISDLQSPDSVSVSTLNFLARQCIATLFYLDESDLSISKDVNNIIIHGSIRSRVRLPTALLQKIQRHNLDEIFLLARAAPNDLGLKFLYPPAFDNHMPVYRFQLSLTLQAECFGIVCALPESLLDVLYPPPSLFDISGSPFKLQSDGDRVIIANRPIHTTSQTINPAPTAAPSGVHTASPSDRRDPASYSKIGDDEIAEGNVTSLRDIVEHTAALAAYPNLQNPPAYDEEAD